MDPTIQRCHVPCVTGCILRVRLPETIGGPCQNGVRACPRCDAQMLIFPGDPNTIYNTPVLFEGVAERNNFVGGQGEGLTGSTFYVGGEPPRNRFNFFGIAVDRPMKSYFLNSAENGHISGDGFDCNCGPNNPCLIRFTRIIPIMGGSRVYLFADSNDNSQLVTIGCSLSGITDPPQPYCGQWFNATLDCTGALPPPG